MVMSSKEFEEKIYGTQQQDVANIVAAFKYEYRDDFFREEYCASFSGYHFWYFADDFNELKSFVESKGKVFNKNKLLIHQV